MAGICSIHQKVDPSCKLCSAHPRDLFPDWDKKIEQAKAAGTTKCCRCGFEYFLTLASCPKCRADATPVTLLDVKTCQIELATEVLWFVNEWCKELGWASPRMKHGNDTSFTIYAFPPEPTGEPET
jgi:hypothetical protein